MLELNYLYLAQSVVHPKQVCGSYILALLFTCWQCQLDHMEVTNAQMVKWVEVCCFSSLASPLEDKYRVSFIQIQRFWMEPWRFNTKFSAKCPLLSLTLCWPTIFSVLPITSQFGNVVPYSDSCWQIWLPLTASRSETALYAAPGEGSMHCHMIDRVHGQVKSYFSSSV